ncbi:MAG: DUF1684 domain-containing protein [Ferruginibacter sp.]|nr:DUF1684 domain-containing protein [Ferruginibacter sp.]
MKRLQLVSLLLFASLMLFAQERKSVKRGNPFVPNTLKFQRKYVNEHEVVLGNEKKYFRFFKPEFKYRVSTNFTKIDDTSTVIIKTSGKKIPEKYFIRYGKLSFTIDSIEYQLTVFQSKDLVNDAEYKNYLFLPFSDKTNGNTTYGTGRYIDLLTTDIKDGKCIIDFNTAYNPYCAYSNDYNCPIPPKENRLPIAITAGEMNFAKLIKH